MVSRSKAVATLVFVDLVGSVVWFPLWWYTVGLQRVIEASYRTIRYRIRSYALRVWLKNFFVPMYGQYDWTGRLVSIFMRFVVLVWRVIQLAIESVLYVVGIIVWIVAPIFFLCMGVISLLQGMRT